MHRFERKKEPRIVAMRGWFVVVAIVVLVGSYVSAFTISPTNFRRPTGLLEQPRDNGFPWFFAQPNEEPKRNKVADQTKVESKSQQALSNPLGSAVRNLLSNFGNDAPSTNDSTIETTTATTSIVEPPPVSSESPASLEEEDTSTYESDEEEMTDEQRRQKQEQLQVQLLELARQEIRRQHTANLEQRKLEIQRQLLGDDYENGKMMIVKEDTTTTTTSTKNNETQRLVEPSQRMQRELEERERRLQQQQDSIQMEKDRLLLEKQRLAKQAAELKAQQRLMQEQKAAQAAELERFEQEKQRRLEIEAEQAQAEEQARLAAEQEEQRRLEEETARLEAEQAERERLEAAEQARLMEERRLVEEARLLKEEARIAAEKEEQRRLEKQAAITARLEHEQRLKEEARIAAEKEEKRRVEEEAAEEARLEEEARIVAEKKKEAAEKARLEKEERRLEEKRAAEEKLCLEKEARIAAELEQRRLEDEEAEKTRLEEEARALEEQRRIEEEAEKARLDEEARVAAEREQRHKEMVQKAEQLRLQEEAQLAFELEERREKEETRSLEDEAQRNAELLELEAIEDRTETLQAEPQEDTESGPGILDDGFQIPKDDWVASLEATQESINGRIAEEMDGFDGPSSEGGSAWSAWAKAQEQADELLSESSPAGNLFGDDEVDIDALAEAARKAVEEFEKMTQKEDLAFDTASATSLAMQGDKDYSKMSVEALKQELGRRGLQSGGNKIELIAQLEESDQIHNAMQNRRIKPDYSAMTVAELKDELRSLGLRVSGSKNVLIARLEDHAADDTLATSNASVLAEQSSAGLGDYGGDEDVEAIARASLEAVEFFESQGYDAGSEDDNDTEEVEYGRFGLPEIGAEEERIGIESTRTDKSLEAKTSYEKNLQSNASAPGRPSENGHDVDDTAFLEELDIDFDSLDLDALGKAAREAVELFDENEEPSDEVLWEIENEINTGGLALDVLGLGEAPQIAVTEILPSLNSEPENVTEKLQPDYEAMSVSQLKSELKRRGLRVTGKKVALIERLQESDLMGQ